MNDAGWVQPIAHIDADVAVVLHAADVLSAAERAGWSVIEKLTPHERSQLMTWLDGYHA